MPGLALRRVVDGINVKRPSFYGDDGGLGWFPEMQRPFQRRLASVYKDYFGKKIYVRPCELALPKMRDPVSVDFLYEFFEQYGVVQVSLLAPWQNNAGMRTAVIEFATPERAFDTMRDLSMRRACGEDVFFVDLLEVNTKGRYGFSTEDILLIREEHDTEVRGRARSNQARPLAPDSYRPSQSLKRQRSPSPLSSTCKYDKESGYSIFNHTNPVAPAMRYPYTPSSPEKPSLPALQVTIEPVAGGVSSRAALLPTPPLEDGQIKEDLADAAELEQFKDLSPWLDMLEPSSHPTYKLPALRSYPTFFAITANNLLIGTSPEEMKAKDPDAIPVHIDDLPEDVLALLGMEQVDGFRWKVKCATQEIWRKDRACTAFKPDQM